MSRADFEAAYIERYGHRPRGWNDDFQVYQDAHANGAWFGWQAGAAGIEAKAAPVGERVAFEEWYGFEPDYSMTGLSRFQLDGDGKYWYIGTRKAWAGFQAGAAYQRQSAVPDAVTMADVMRAWEYAEDHPHKYLRGTTNWCAAVAHSLNQRSQSAPATVQGDADNYRWLRKQHNNVNSDIGVYDGANILATPEGNLDLDAAIAAARQEGGKV